MFLENFTKFIKYYGKDKHAQIFGFLVLSFIAGFLEFIGIALIYPFILMIVQPETVIKAAPWLNKFMYSNNPALTALLLGLMVLLIFIFKNIFIIFSQYVQNKFVAHWKRDITQLYMQYYIYAPYKDVMSIPQAEKLYVLGTLCTQAIDGFIMRGLNFLTNVVIIFMVITLLLIKFPLAAIVTIIFVAISMLLQNKYFKNRTAAIANNLGMEFEKYNSALIENINNIKEIKILSAEKMFFGNYCKNENSFREIQALQGFYSSIPPYIVEILIVISLLILAAIISIENIKDYSSLIASFAIIVASLFRIAPALNRIQTSIININASRDFVKRINKEYENCNLQKLRIYNSDRNKKINFENRILLKNINFSYNNDKQIIKNLSLEINKGDFIGIIGLSGAGKSTLADIIMGLLPVGHGEIFVDNIKLNDKNFSMFRNIIGYVPQQVNIMDKSFKENVAWGIPPEDIDEKGVIKALKAAQIYDFVMEFKDGIYTPAISSSNGLSQGQKQRLAIARALYRDPEVLIFDEATSSLDVKVESEITEMLTTFSSSKTIIAIAHRLSTLKACNKLVYLKEGRIVDIGTFEELSERHEDFEALIKLSSLK